MGRKKRLSVSGEKAISVQGAVATCPVVYSGFLMGELSSFDNAGRRTRSDRSLPLPVLKQPLFSYQNFFLFVFFSCNSWLSRFKEMDYPITTAVRYLREHDIEIVPHLFEYIEKGGTSHSSTELGVEESSIVKTLVFETNENKPFIVLMQGHLMVSTKKMARHMNVKSVAPVTPEKANRLTGYIVGGTSPFGVKTKMPIFVEETIFDLDRIYINGGKRGFLVEMPPAVLNEVLDCETVIVGIERK